eukprot:354410-Chlamydomonas_euryale.AAC.1
MRPRFDVPAGGTSPHQLTRPCAHTCTAARGGVTLQCGVRATLGGVRAAAPDARQHQRVSEAVWKVFKHTGRKGEAAVSEGHRLPRWQGVSHECFLTLHCWETGEGLTATLHCWEVDEALTATLHCWEVGEGLTATLHCWRVGEGLTATLH